MIAENDTLVQFLGPGVALAYTDPRSASNTCLKMDHAEVLEAHG